MGPDDEGVVYISVDMRAGLCVACSIAFFSMSCIKKFAKNGESGKPTATPSTRHRSRNMWMLARD